MDDHEGRIHVAGNYDKHECGMKISQAILNDTGEWRVEVNLLLNLDKYQSMNLISTIGIRPQRSVYIILLQVTEFTDKNPITFFTANPAYDHKTFQIQVTGKPSTNS